MFFHIIAHPKYMYNWSVKQKLHILKTIWGLSFINTIVVPYWQPPARHFYHFNNRIFRLKSPVKKDPGCHGCLLFFRSSERPKKLRLLYYRITDRLLAAANDKIGGNEFSICWRKFKYIIEWWPSQRTRFNEGH